MEENFILVGLVIGLTQLVKDTGLSSRFSPLVALALAMGLGYALGLPWLESLVAGLSSMGLYSSKKVVTG